MHLRKEPAVSAKEAGETGGAQLWYYITLPFAVDLRTLALFRICLGLMVIVDLILRSRDLVAFHTDDGVFPRSLAVQSLDWSFSFHFMSGMAIFQAVLFLFHAFFAFLMMVGYRTRISTFLTLLLTISVQARNPYIVQGSDILLTV